MGSAQHGTTARRGWWIVGPLMLACTEFAAGTDELEASSAPLDPAAAGPGADWSCLDIPPASSNPVPGAAITYTVRLLDIGTRNAIPDAVVTVCGLTDVNCESPILDGLGVDEDGWLDIPLAENFSGYLEFRSPSTVPAVFHLGEGLRTMTEFPFLAVTVPAFQALTAAVGVVNAPNTGTISVRNLDCQSSPAPRIALTHNTGGVPFYFANGLPDITQRETDAEGMGGFTNVPPGLTLLQSRLPDGTVIDRRSLIIRPNWLTTAFLRPAGFEPPRLPAP